jgi:hypothetical protein
MAQVDIGKGLVVGLNFASAGGSDVPSSFSSTTQYSFGGFLDIKLPAGIALQPEILYSVKGASGTFLNTNGTTKISYLDIPVLVKYTFPGVGVKPVIFAGPSLGIKLSAKVKIDASGETMDIKDHINSTDFGLVIGAGVEIPLSAISLVADARYNFGLSRVVKSGYITGGDANIYNRVFSINAGVEF